MATDAAADAFEHVADDLGEAARSQMFGKPCLKIGSKAFACLFRDAMAFKLDERSREQALALSGAVLFDPSGRGRPMREWVQVPVDHVDEWGDLARRSLAYVRGSR